MFRNRRRIAAVTVLALLGGGWLGFEQLMPRVPGGFKSGQSRLGWYFASGQWHADARTAAAAAGYMFSPDNEILPATSATNQQVAEVAPATPKPQS